MVRNKKELLESAKNMMEWDAIEWNTVILTDEKKLNMDGQDGLCHYWNDLRQEREIFSKRKKGEASVMVWGAVSKKGNFR